MRKPIRPILRYHGGKWRLAPWVISHFPPHRVYVEPYGGAASVLMRKPRSYAEIYNELDPEVYNVFRVLRDPDLSAELEKLLYLTPFSRLEFEIAYEIKEQLTDVEQARRTIVKAYMGFGSNAIHAGKARGMCTRASTWTHDTGFRANSYRSGTTPAHDWARYPNHISVFRDRLAGVVIENRKAIDCMQQHDRGDTLHYVDPPYVMSSRSDPGKDYMHEMTDDDHRELAEVLRSVKGMVVLSGYRSELYDELYGDWERFDKKAYADGARERMECLWLSPRAMDARGLLF
ncbi:MAG: DNA adenine methylase [Armatimonadota bacterium]